MSLTNVKHIILILSGKGGVGKSSITTQLALSLSLASHSVGILDLDLTGPSIPHLFNQESAKITQAPGGWLPVRVHPSQTLPPPPPPPHQQPDSKTPAPTPSPQRTNGHDAPEQTTPPTQIGSLHIMSLGFLLPSRTSAVVWRGPKKTAMVRQFLTDVLWPPIDYLLIDTPPGTSDEHISLVETLLKNLSSSPLTSPRLAGAVLVTTPQAISTADVRKELNFCAKVGVEVLGVVENMSGYVCECCGVGSNLFSKGGGEVMSREFGVRFLGSVPLDGQWGVLVEEGRRPRYGGIRVGGGDVEDEDENEDSRENADDGGKGEEKSRDEGLLVDLYRSCSLYEVFGGITRELMAIVEGTGGDTG